MASSKMLLMKTKSEVNIVSWQMSIGWKYFIFKMILFTFTSSNSLCVFLNISKLYPFVLSSLCYLWTNNTKNCLFIWPHHVMILTNRGNTGCMMLYIFLCFQSFFELLPVCANTSSWLNRILWIWLKRLITNCVNFGFLKCVNEFSILQ